MAPPERPLVTVAVCVHNAGPWLRESLRSVLDQTYDRLEVFVVDDGSTDGGLDTISDIEDERLVVIRQENLGKPAALNRVLEEGRGEYFAIHDADDLSHPERVAEQVACLEADASLGACLTQHDLIIADRRMAPRRHRLGVEECAAHIARMRIPGNDPTAMFRRSSIGELRYEHSLRIAQGTDFLLRFGEEHPMVVLGRPLYSYRVHLESNSRRDAFETERYALEVVRRACERRGIDVQEHLREHPRRAPTSRREYVDRLVVSHFKRAVVEHRHDGDVVTAMRLGLQCARLRPGARNYYKPLVWSVALPRLLPRPAAPAARRASQGA